MRSTVALTGTAALAVALLSGCSSDDNAGAPAPSAGAPAPMPSTSSTSAAPSGSAVTGNTGDPGALPSMKGDWKGADKGTSYKVAVADEGRIRVAKDGTDLLDGRLVRDGANHYQVQVNGSSATKITADLGPDGRTLTVRGTVPGTGLSGAIVVHKADG